jgi:hypothetical protein
MRIGNILTMLGLIAVAAILGADGNLQAQVRHSAGSPQIKEAGRWHVQTLSGDQPAQVATGKPVSFDGAFECASTACGGIQVFAHDSTICDPVDFENMSSGLDIDGITGAFQFGVSGGFGDFFRLHVCGNVIRGSHRSRWRHLTREHEHNRHLRFDTRWLQ